jgi:hypothetical protein
MNEQVLLGGVTIDCKDPKFLSDFYIRMLQWEKTYEDDGFIVIASSTCNVRIGFQRNAEHVPPVWPETQNSQQQQVHLDFKVNNKEHMIQMVDYAIRCGATKAKEQFSDLWTVMIDPAGHPFCFDTL